MYPCDTLVPWAPGADGMKLESMHSRERMILRTLGRNLAAERRRNEMTQEQVAALAGIATTQLARMEQGRHDSRVTTYLKVAWAIGVEPAELFRGLEQPRDADEPEGDYPHL